MTGRTGTKTLKTQRLVLRKILPHDYFEASRWYTNPEIAEFMIGKKPLSKFQVFRLTAGRMIKYTNKSYYYWAIVYDGKMKGLVELIPVKDRNDVFALHYKLDMKLKNKGITTEAVSAVIEYCKTQSMTGLIAMCDADNIGSERVMQKAGMVQYGDVNTNKPFEYADGTTGKKLCYKIKF